MSVKSQTTDPQRLILAYRPPYDWQAVLSFLATRAIPGIDCCHDGTYTRTIEIHGRRGILAVRNDTARNALVAQLEIAATVDLSTIAQRLQSMFDLDVDPAAVSEVLSVDERLGPLVAARPGLRLPGCWDPFELIVRAILGQQITVAAARTIATRVVERYGRPFGSGTRLPCGQAPRLFPNAQTLAAADIQSIGMPGRRVQTLQSFAQAVTDDAIDLNPGADGERLTQQLLSIKGIGQWTAGYVQLRTLKDPDAFPPGDIALLRAAQSLGIAQTQPQLQQAAQAWRPWRASAVAYLWRSLAEAKT